jgi:hypothetical protein
MAINWRTRTLALISAIVLLSCSRISTAAPVTYSLWGANWGGWLQSPPLRVGQIDPVSGQAAYSWIVEGMSRSGVLDFASDPLRNTSVVWSLNSTKPFGYELLSFDPYRKKILSNIPLDDSLELQGLAIDPTTGLFYATSQSALYQLNPTTGHAELIGPTSLHAAYSLGFDLKGNLFSISGLSNGTRALIAVDTLTGDTNVVAEVEVYPADIAVHPATGVMYGLGFDNQPSVDYGLYQIDLTTGAIANIGQSLFRPAGLAFTAIPEPTAFTLALLVGIAAVATLRHARR